MRVIVRTSKWAIWARRFGRLALPVALIGVAFHHTGSLSSETFTMVLALSVMIATAAIAAGITGLVRIWVTGDQGWRACLFAILFGMFVLGPFFYGMSKGIGLPATNTISTSPSDPPQIIGANPFGWVDGSSDAEGREALAMAFPAISTRTYQRPVSDSYAIALEVAEGFGWQARVTRGPANAFAGAQINMVAVTFLGYRDEVSIRLRPIAAGTRIDVRSASYWGVGDLGKNGERVSDYLLALDSAFATAPAAAEPEV